MRKSTKGAVAASAAAILLIGGWGTHATWSSGEAIGGGAVNTGYLELTGGCHGWLIGVDLSQTNPVYVNLDDLKLAPGNVLTQVCDFTVNAAGINVKAKLSATAPGMTGGDAADLAGNLQLTSNFTDGAGQAIGGTTELNDGDKIQATLTVELLSGVGNELQNLSTTLDQITVTATQV